MISKNGESRLSLSEADLMEAVQLFIKEHNYVDREKVTGIQVHKKGSKYAVSVTVERKAL